MLSNHLIFCCPLFLLPLILQPQSLFQWVGSLHEVAKVLTFTTRHIHSWASFPHQHGCFILSGAISNCPLLFPNSILDTFLPGDGGGTHLLVSYFAFSYCSWGSCSKNTGVICHSLLQWTYFVRNFHCDLSILCGPEWHGSQLQWITQVPSPCQGCDP